MDRRAAREIALQLGFSASMTKESAAGVIEEFFSDEHYATMAEESELFAEKPSKKQMEYISRLVSLICEHSEELDAYIEKYSRGWKVERISKTARAIMRCAMCEVLYFEDIPNNVAVSEAVQLAKGYEDSDVVKYINGVLGSFVRGEVDAKPAESEETPAAEAEPAEEAVTE